MWPPVLCHPILEELAMRVLTVGDRFRAGVVTAAILYAPTLEVCGR
jgi:hypothetical protein